MSSLVSGDDLPSRLLEMERMLRNLERASRSDRTVPFTYVPCRPIAAPTAAYGTIAVTTTWVDCWRAQSEIVTHEAIACWVSYSSDVGTTGEIRLKLNTSPVVQTTAGAVGSGAAGFFNFRWLHGQAIGNGPHFITVEARRTSGAGNVYVACPEGGIQFCQPHILNPAPTTAGL